MVSPEAIFYFEILDNLDWKVLLDAGGIRDQPSALMREVLDVKQGVEVVRKMLEIKQENDREVNAAMGAIKGILKGADGNR